MHRLAAATVAVVVAVGASTGCGLAPLVSGSGTIVESTPDIEPFTSLAVGSAFEVTLQTGDDTSLVVRIDDNLVDRLDVGVSDGELFIGLDGGVRSATLEADLTVPADSLESITLDGAASLSGVEPVTSPRLSAQLSGASRAFLVTHVDELDVSASGASVASIGGDARTLIAEADGASSLRLDQLDATTARVEAQGASTVEVTVSGDLVARASGASTVRYSGDPDTVERDVSGASTVTGE